MQEYTVLPKLGVSPKKFWSDVKQDVKNNAGDEMLSYMRLLLDRIEAQKTHLTEPTSSRWGREKRTFRG